MASINQEETLIEMFGETPNFRAEYGTVDRVQSTTEFYATNWNSATVKALMFGEIIGVVNLSSLRKLIPSEQTFVLTEREAE